MKESINKISIIGGSGTGKTVLSNNLSKELNIPVYHIDGIHHLENWKERDKEERDQIILDIIKKDKWIIDGTYRSTLLQRLETSDLVIYLDYSSASQVRGVMKRYLKNHGKEKEEIKGCKERMNLTFFKQVLFWRKNKRNEIISKIGQVDNDKIIIFKNRRQLNKWYKELFNKSIKV